MVRFANRKPFAAVGLHLHRGTLKELLAGCSLGILMMAAIFCVLWLPGWASASWRTPDVGRMLLILGSGAAVFAVGAAVEEILFRGYPFQTLVQGISFLPAMLAMGVLFAAAHIPNPHMTVFSFVNILFASIWLSFAYLKTRGLWLPFGLHWGWNFAQTTLFGFPTSGLQMADHRLLSVSVAGPAWLTGGAFGPEGGLLATLALAGGTWFILKSRHLEAQEGIITLDTVEDLPIPAPPGETPA